MADKEKGGAATLPKALGDRERTIILGNGESVVVKRWAWSKGVKVLRTLWSILEELGDEKVKELKGKDNVEAIGRAVELFEDKLIPFLKICVQDADADKVTDELPLEDVVSILEAVINLNMTEGLTKKVRGLWRRFVPKSAENGEKSASSLPSEPSAQPASPPSKSS